MHKSVWRDGSILRDGRLVERAIGDSDVRESPDVRVTRQRRVPEGSSWIKPAAFEDCVKKCVKEGSEAVFVTEDNKILKVDPASKEKVAQYLGHKVSVTGKVEGTILKIDSITALKLQ